MFPLNLTSVLLFLSWQVRVATAPDLFVLVRVFQTLKGDLIVQNIEKTTGSSAFRGEHHVGVTAQPGAFGLPFF